jgi:hypothetical protein
MRECRSTEQGCEGVLPEPSTRVNDADQPVVARDPRWPA